MIIGLKIDFTERKEETKQHKKVIFIFIRQNVNNVLCFSLCINLNQLYLKTIEYIFISILSGKVLVGPGTQEQTFQCFLPLNLPTSVESKDAYNRYSATVVLDKAFLHCHVIKKSFVVIRPLDLNDYMSLMVG